MRADAGLHQSDLVDRVNEITGHVEGKGRLTQPRISDLERGSGPLERDLANLAAIDVVCGFEPGHALELAGFCKRSGEMDLETAIQTLPAQLDQEGRTALLGVLRALAAKHLGDGPLRTPGMVEAEEALRQATRETGDPEVS